VDTMDDLLISIVYAKFIAEQPLDEYDIIAIKDQSINDLFGKFNCVIRLKNGEFITCTAKRDNELTKVTVGKERKPRNVFKRFWYWITGKK